jgi:hypothetical protein
MALYIQIFGEMMLNDLVFFLYLLSPCIYLFIWIELLIFQEWVKLRSSGY